MQARKNETNQIKVLDFRRKNITHHNMSAVIQFLYRCNEKDSHVKIDLGINEIDDKAAEELAQALSKNQFIKHLHLDLTSNQISTAGVQALVKASGAFSSFNIDLANNSLPIEAASELAQFLISENNPKELGVGLGFNHLGTEVATLLANALKTGLCQPNLYLDIRSNNIGIEGVNAIAEALESGLCPLGLQLKFGLSNIDLDGFKRLMHVLGDERKSCPSNLLLDFSMGSLGDEALKALAAALETGFCPPGLRINLSSNDITDVGVEALARALKSGLCPQGLEINLNSNNVTHVGMEHLAAAFRSGKCPQGLVLDLKQNSAVPQGQAEHPIVEALLSCTAVTGFTASLLFKAIFSSEQRKKIDFYCLRNQLIEKYPQLESFIKEVCLELGMYKPGMKPMTSLSLRCLSGSVLVFNKAIMPIEEGKLPLELKEFLDQLEGIKEQLHSSLSCQN